MTMKVKTGKMINLELIYFFEYFAICVVIVGIIFILFDRNIKQFMEPKIIKLSETAYPLLLMEKQDWLDKPEYRKESTELMRVINELTNKKVHLNEE